MILTWVFRAAFVPLLVLAIISSNCQAAEFYGSLDLGQASINETVDISSSLFDLDDSDFAWRGSLGVDVTDYFAVEASYVDFGSVSASIVGQDISASADGAEIAVIARIPLGESFGLAARLSSVWWSASTSVAGVGASSSDNDVSFGAGFEFRPTERFGIGLGYDRYNLDDLDVDMLTVGLRFSF